MTWSATSLASTSAAMRSTRPRSSAVWTAESISGPSMIDRTARSASGLRRTRSSASSARADATARLSSSMAAISLRSSAAPAPGRAAPAARPQMPNGSVTVDSCMPPSRSDPVAQAAHGERADDVADALHQAPDPGEDQQRVGLLDEELPARPEREDEHRDAAHEPQPPDRVDVALDERPDHPPDADHQEQEAEDVGDARERVLGLDEAEDAGDQKQPAEDRPEPPCGLGDRGENDVLDAGEAEHDPDDHADGRDRRLVELQDHQGSGDPRDPDDDPQPPQTGHVTSGLTGVGHADRRTAELRSCTYGAHQLLLEGGPPTLTARAPVGKGGRKRPAVGRTSPAGYVARGVARGAGIDCTRSCWSRTVLLTM